MAQNFLGLEDDQAALETACAVIVPVPYETTCSYGKGASRGPRGVGLREQLRQGVHGLGVTPNAKRVDDADLLSSRECGQRPAQGIIRFFGVDSLQGIARDVREFGCG